MLRDAKSFLSGFMGSSSSDSEETAISGYFVLCPFGFSVAAGCLFHHGAQENPFETDPSDQERGMKSFQLPRRDWRDIL